MIFYYYLFEYLVYTVYETIEKKRRKKLIKKKIKIGDPHSKKGLRADHVILRNRDLNHVTNFADHRKEIKISQKWPL